MAICLIKQYIASAHNAWSLRGCMSQHIVERCLPHTWLYSFMRKIVNAENSTRPLNSSFAYPALSFVLINWISFILINWIQIFITHLTSRADSIRQISGLQPIMFLNQKIITFCFSVKPGSLEQYYYILIMTKHTCLAIVKRPMANKKGDT